MTELWKLLKTELQTIGITTEHRDLPSYTPIFSSVLEIAIKTKEKTRYITIWISRDEREIVIDTDTIKSTKYRTNTGGFSKRILKRIQEYIRRITDGELSKDHQS